MFWNNYKEPLKNNKKTKATTLRAPKLGTIPRWLSLNTRVVSTRRKVVSWNSSWILCIVGAHVQGDQSGGPMPTCEKHSNEDIGANSVPYSITGLYGTEFSAPFRGPQTRYHTAQLFWGFALRGNGIQEEKHAM